MNAALTREIRLDFRLSLSPATDMVIGRPYRISGEADCPARSYKNPLYIDNQRRLRPWGRQMPHHWERIAALRAR
ncbi:MAG: hypothetical protein IJT44_09845 [Clostridia bacterium]|nr:hypothetical protein [Clostridia bacterium]